MVILNINMRLNSNLDTLKGLFSFRLRWNDVRSTHTVF